MYQFKAGDKVRQIVHCRDVKEGQISILKKCNFPQCAEGLTTDTHASGCHCNNFWELVEKAEEISNDKPMFKIGDRVKIKQGCSGTSLDEEIVLKANPSGILSAYGKNSTDSLHCSCQNYWELIEEYKSIKINPKKYMKKLSLMLKKLLDKDAQILYKADYINGDLELTEKGKASLMGILFETNKTELVRLAQEELDEAKEK